MPSPRDHLRQALQSDLIGPYDPSTGEEVLRLPPLRWYLTGFLVPEMGALEPATASSDEDEELDAGDDLAGDGEASSGDPEAKQRPILPSSVGLTVLLPPASGPGFDEVVVMVRWGEYVLRSTSEEVEALCRARGMKAEDYLPQGQRTVPLTLWERVVQPERPVSLPLSQSPGALHRQPVPGAPGVRVEYRVEDIAPADADALRIGEPGQGARALSVFLVNARAMTVDRERDPRGHSYELNGNSLFQVQLRLEAGFELLPRPDAHFAQSEDFDDQMVDLQFRHEMEWAVGHGIATEPLARDRSKPMSLHENPVVGAAAVWLPHATVAKVQPSEIEGVTVDMRTLAQVHTPEQVDEYLGALPGAYREWIEGQARIPLHQATHRQTQAELVRRATLACERIEGGLALLRSDEDMRQAFRWANEAMAEVATRRIGRGKPGFVPKWRLFQLAFLLLNLRGIADPEHDDRRAVDLLFFPTGGGKTEAYLGVIAISLLLRRMRGRERPDQGLGVAVILRYTLRLLTLDQLERASALVCSLELLRREHPQVLGTARYSIGLWVGRSGSPNTMAEAHKLITDYRGRTAESKGSPFPLVTCPWCSTPIEARTMDTLPRGKKHPVRTVVVCANSECEFSALGRGAPGTKVGELPVLFVDEQIYRELPSFLVSTVDKLALLTHRGEAGKLFGRVHSYTEQRGHTPAFWGGGDGEDHVAVSPAAEPLPQGLLPPELVVQDELHLISGPLGTMVGLFETLVEELCRHDQVPSGARVGPKILAATATVRRASRQVQALYARTPEQTHLFPPQGVDAWQTFFAERDTTANERMYVGLAATGRSMKRILLQSYLTLLGAAEHLLRSPGPSQPPLLAADPYTTVVGYFNSLRELGGMRRLVDDDIFSRVGKLHERIPHDHRGGRAEHRWLRNRAIVEPIELTSRIRSAELTRDKARLRVERPAYEASKAAKQLEPGALQPVDVVLASNMISVGVDIDRLGLMVVAGQPKTTSEYIQATSRVGRDDDRPGLVLTVYNVHKPRDRSHYEHFGAYHESFYRYVEAGSVTPFSLPALDRGLASVLVGLTRHVGGPRAAAPTGAGELKIVQQMQPRVAQILRERAQAQPGGQDEGTFIEGRAKRVFDQWRRIIRPTAESRGSSVKHCYSPYEQKRASALALLRTPEADAALDPEQRYASNDPRYPFVAPTSMRDVEPTTAIWVRRRPKTKDR